MYALIILLLCATLFPHYRAVATPTAKTFFKSSNAPHWLSSETRPFQYNKKPATKPLHSALSFTAFYSHSSDKKRLGNYFGFYDDASGEVKPFLRVTADNTIAASLRPQDIVHDVAHSADPFNVTTNPLAETIYFNPHIEQYGLIINNAMQINEWITVHTIMPWMQSNHVLGIKNTDVTKTTVEDRLVSVSDFFNGTLHQEEATNPNQQDRLLYGKLRNQQSCSGLADITILCLFTPYSSEEGSIDLGPLVTIPTCNRAHGSYLFEPVLGTGSHTVLGAQARGTIKLGAINLITFAASGTLTGRVGVTSHEVRSPSFLFNYDGGTDGQFARYALAGKQHARRLFPLINMLTQMVSVKPGTTVEAEARIAAQYKGSTLAFEYRFTHTGQEKVSPLSAWPAQTYALAKHTYSQTTNNNLGVVTGYNTFTIADHSDLLNQADLTDAALHFDACATPIQKTHLVGASFQCIPTSALPYTSLHVRAYYAWAHNTSFGIGSYGASCSISHSF